MGRRRWLWWGWARWGRWRRIGACVVGGGGIVCMYTCLDTVIGIGVGVLYTHTHGVHTCRRTHTKHVPIPHNLTQHTYIGTKWAWRKGLTPNGRWRWRAGRSPSRYACLMEIYIYIHTVLTAGAAAAAASIIIQHPPPTTKHIPKHPPPNTKKHNKTCRPSPSRPCPPPNPPSGCASCASTTARASNASSSSISSWAASSSSQPPHIWP